MRPAKLTVAGMRSYRAQRTLDFSHRTLMAILGDTGSGKSSLLEALFGALYGGSTWDARGLGVLIADGVKTLQIELEFQARGKTYTVSRSCSRDAYPPSKHVFKGPDGEHLDGEKDVNRRVAELVGLTGPEFLRVVILPQGRFGQLLQGTAGERTPILRGILGLGVLDRVKEIADRQGTNLAAALEPIVAARARLYPAPQAVAATAETASKKHHKVVKKLDSAATALRDLDSATAAVSRALPALLEALNLAAAIDLQSVIADLVKADAADKKAAVEDKDFTARLEELEKQDTAMKTELAAATTAGFTQAALATMSAALTWVATTLPDLAREAQAQAEEQTALAAEDGQLAVDAQAVQTGAEIAESHRLALAGLVTAADDAREQARLRAERIAAIDRALGDLAPREEQLAKAVGELLLGAQALLQARSNAGAATSARNAAAEELAALRDANAAAHVARQHTAGQPCPVCGQTLPVDFAPPEIVGEQNLLDALELAEQQMQTATAAERSRQRTVDVSHQTLLSAAAGAAAAASTVSQLLRAATLTGAADSAAVAAAVDAAVQRILDLPAGKPPTPTRSAQDTAELTEALRSLTGLDAAARLAASSEAAPSLEEAQARQTSMAEALVAAQGQVQELLGHAKGLAAEHRAATEAHNRRRGAHQAATDRTTQVAQHRASEIRKLPPLLSEPLVSSLNLTAPDPAAALLTAGQVPPDLLIELHGRLDSKQAELAEFNDEREKVGAALRDLTTQRGQLRDARHDAVDRPRAQARRSWERAGTTLLNLAKSLRPLYRDWEPLSSSAGTPPLPPRTAELTDAVGTDPTDQLLSVAVSALQTRLELAVSQASDIAAAAEDGVRFTVGKAQDLLSVAGATTLNDLTERLSQARQDLRMSTALHDRAAQQVPLAAGLDIGIAGLRSQVAVLRQVKDLLSPSAFPQYVVQQRQVALLRIASSLLGQLTRGGYGFGDDFMIVDRRTGQPRHPKTLSGGETFLASLALALALVEISNRSGGQLDCLFLDEGFGSLDSSILGEALDVLRLQATGGRLVGVISHLHAVAAELDDVLVVTKEVEGSSFRWLDPEERDAYLLDEAAVGLLS